MRRTAGIRDGRRVYCKLAIMPPSRVLDVVRPLSLIWDQYFQHCRNLTGSSRRFARWVGFTRPPAASTREDFHHWLS